jgi:DNA-binding NtrC family response regulator
MMNMYEALRYTEQRQAEDRESARVWRLAREVRRQPQARMEAIVSGPSGTRRQLVSRCDGNHSSRGRRPTVQ